MGTNVTRLLVLSVAVLLVASGSARGRPAFESPEIPRLSISNGVLEALLLLPEAKTGYYRGPRFDWSGLIARVKFEGHTYFGEWKTPHDPAGNDDVVGPAEEFGMGWSGLSGPLGYAEAKPGEEFLKIGVGWQKKIEEPEYRFWFNYQITRPGIWRIRHGRNWVEFRQDVSDASGWGYQYTKKVDLIRNRPEMVIAHSLRNTGSKRLVTSYYGHNFTIIDNEPIGPAYRVQFPFPVTTQSDLEGRAEVHGSAITFARILGPDESVFAEFGGFSGSASDNGATIENLKSGAGVKIAGDKPVQQFHFFAVRSAVCPEPFLQIELAPGEHAEWQATYTFFHDGPKDSR